ncbi:hypothetical protein CLOP_g19545 [Closterium sp. NIES-67]|nr:hypothetical protein CLOP_g19545 [Closterium sp. NIES-67]
MAALRIDEGEPVEDGVQKFFDLLTRLEGADLNYSQEGRGARGGRGRGRGGRGGRGSEAACMKGGDYETGPSEDRYPGQFFFVSTQAAAAAGGVEGFEEPATVGKACESKESGAAAKGGGNEEENHKISKAAAAKEKGESLWGTIASAAFSNPTSATGECDWLTLHRRMGHVALPILQQIVKQDMLGAAGAEYFLTIVDVYTRMTWVYVLPKKSDVAETVKTDWLPMVERQQDRLVKAIRTDRGGDSTITRQSPQMNGGEEEEEVQQGDERTPSLPPRATSARGNRADLQQRHESIQVPAVEEEGRGRRRTQPPNRLVAKGYQQQEKKDYNEVYAPVVKGTTLRTLFAAAAIKGWVVKQMDIVTAFLNGVLEEETYMEQPEGYNDGSGRVWKLKKALYGLKQAPRQWYIKLREVLEAIGFKCVKGRAEESVGEEERRRFHSLVGSLMYAAVHTRPDAAFATGQLARVVQCPNEEQVAAGERVAKYLGQTATVGLQYSAAAQRRQKGADGVEPGRLFLTAFSDASWASEPEDMTSVGGFICCVGGGPTAWESKKQ